MANIPILTPLELKVMDILWQLEKGFIKDILDHWSESEKKAYNTISTIVRILQEKGYVDHHAHGRTHEYFPIIGRDEYQRVFIENAVQKVFSGSVSSLISALVDNDTVSKEELEELKKLIENSKK